MRYYYGNDNDQYSKATAADKFNNNEKYTKDNIVNVSSTKAINNSNDNVVNDISTTAQQSNHNSGSHDNHKGTE